MLTSHAPDAAELRPRRRLHALRGGLVGEGTRPAPAAQVEGAGELGSHVRWMGRRLGCAVAGNAECPVLTVILAVRLEGRSHWTAAGDGPWTWRRSGQHLSTPRRAAQRLATTPAAPEPNRYAPGEYPLRAAHLKLAGQSRSTPATCRPPIVEIGLARTPTSGSQ